MEIILFFIAHWYSSLFFQTFFHHRYAAHRMFTMSRFWEKMFFIGSAVTQGASYLSPHAYGILHRLHHSHADTEKDPHSPKYDPSLFAMMWRTKNIYQDIWLGRHEVDEKYKKNLPRWTKFDHFASHRGTRLFWLAAYTAFYFLFAASWWWFLLLPLHFIMGPLHGAIINWFAHKYGYVNYKIKDTSKNLFPLDFLMLGEGYHNNHHKFQGSPNFSKKWYEFDPVYPFIRLFHLLGIIRLKQA